MTSPRYEVRHDDHIWDNKTQKYVMTGNDEADATQLVSTANRLQKDVGSDAAEIWLEDEAKNRRPLK